MTTTNSVPEMTRAEKRRLWKDYNRTEAYKRSGFLDFVEYKGVSIPNPSKYQPHIGNKQKQKGL